MRDCDRCGDPVVDPYPTRSNLCRPCHHQDCMERRERRGAKTPSPQAAHKANCSAAKHGIEGRLTQGEVEKVLSVGRCFYCGGTKKLGIDHIIPLSKGGPNNRLNLVAACASCNSSKKDKPLHEWAPIRDRRIQACL